MLQVHKTSINHNLIIWCREKRSHSSKFSPGSKLYTFGIFAFQKEFDTGGILLNILAPGEQQIFHDKTSLPKTTSRTIMKFMVNLIKHWFPKLHQEQLWNLRLICSKGQCCFEVYQYYWAELRFKLNQNRDSTKGVNTTGRTGRINCTGKQNKTGLMTQIMSLLHQSRRGALSNGWLIKKQPNEEDTFFEQRSWQD